MVRFGCVGNIGEHRQVPSVIFNRLLTLMIFKVNEENHNVSFNTTGECDAERRTTDNDFNY